MRRPFSRTPFSRGIKPIYPKATSPPQKFFRRTSETCRNLQVCDRKGQKIVLFKSPINNKYVTYRNKDEPYIHVRKKTTF